MRDPSRLPGSWRLGAGAVLASALSLGAAMPVSAQDNAVVLTGRAYPVAIHAGTCNELIAEPSYDLGFAQPRPLIAIEGVDDDGLLTTGDFYEEGDDRLIDETTVLVTGDDRNGDGIADYGFDLNENQILDTDELFDRPIVWSFLGDLDDLTTLVGDDDDVALQDLRDVPHAVVVHETAVTDTSYLSCGEIEGVAINDEVVIPMLPVTENGLTGVTIMEAGTDGFLGIGGDAGLTDVHLWPRVAPISLAAITPPTPTPIPPTPTPLPPTPTPVPPTPTPVPPTPTPVPPTPTPVPPTPTPVPPTPTPVPPTPTPVPPTPTPVPPTPTPIPPTPTPVPPTPTPVPPTPTPVPPTPTPVVIEVPTRVTVEFRDEGMNPLEFTILENTDTEFILANLTLDPKTFFIDGLDVTQEVPAGETLAIIVNAPIGEYGYGLVDDETQRGTLNVIERAE